MTLLPQPVCRSCAGHDLFTFLDLGASPLADRFVTREQLGQSEPFFPLRTALCRECGLVQILDTVSPEVLFCEDYPYYSSFSPALLRHSEQNVTDLIDMRQLTKKSLVIELASNDGYLLQYYHSRGIKVLGIDPASGPAAVANAKGITTMVAFFTQSLAADLRAKGAGADIVHANNVLAHVPDTNGFLAGIGMLLKQDGLAVIEAPYLRDLIEKCEFDTIYHEHHCYFSVSSVEALASRHDLVLRDVRHVPIHGGSLRYYLARRGEQSAAVRRMMSDEREAGMLTDGYYRGFAEKVAIIKDSLCALLREIKSQGKRIAAYGAAAKGTTLLNYTGIGPDLIDFVADRNSHKHGRYMPGQHIPIVGPEEIVGRMPDYVLVLAWNFADEIRQQQRDYLARGGKLIVPIPIPTVIPAG